MKTLTNEQRRISLKIADDLLLGGGLSREKHIAGPDKRLEVLQAKLQQDLTTDAPVSLGEAPLVAVNTEAEIGGRKKASKTGAMLWRPGTDTEIARLLVGPRMGQVATREIFESVVRDLVDVQRGYLGDDGQRSDFDRIGFSRELRAFESLLEKDHALFKSLNAEPGLERQQVEARTSLVIDRWTKGRSSYHGTEISVEGPQHLLQQAAWGAFDRANARLERLEDALSHALDDGAASRLVKSQAAFVKYRDLVSKFDAKEQGGGKVGELVRASVAEGMTNERIALLEKLLGQVEGDNAKRLVLISAQVALESKNKPLPKALERVKEINRALKEIYVGLEQADMKPTAMEMEKQQMEKLRSASIEASYTEWMRMPGSPSDRAALAVQLMAVRDTATELLGRLDELPGGGHAVKEGYARLLDVLSSVDGSLKRLAHGKEP